MTGWIALVAAAAVSGAVGLLWRSLNGRMRAVGSAAALATDDLVALGIEPGARATLVQFSSAFCAPCRATRRVLSDVADMVPGVAYAEIDAESNLDLVRRFNVLRTPTVLVVDRDGRLLKRASGQPRKADVIAALAPLVAS
ncbi:MAG: thioredoxin family protein [Frankia sp.]|nr:thioredoxin family protein [Frankia sp.]